MNLTSIESNRQRLDGGAMFGNAPRSVWEKWIAPDEQGRIPLACRCLLIESDGAKILCETGIGGFFEPKMASRFGIENPERHMLRENLLASGHTLDSIDYVILSHLHFDHAGGLLPTYREIQNGDEGLIFPQAQFIVGPEAWNRALHPHARDRASFIPHLTAKLEASGRLHLLPHNPMPAPLRDRFEFLTTDGHTPGQIHVLYHGQHSQVLFCGDLVPGLAWVHVPITMGYDRFPERLIEEKSAIYQRAVAENWLLFYTHDPNVPASHVQLSGDGHKYLATDPLTSLVRVPV